MATPSITVTLLGRDYQVACPPEEEEAFRRSVRHLDQQMELMRSRSTSLSYEKIAVLAALTATHDLLKLTSETNNTEIASVRELKQLEKKIDNALVNARQIEI
jgi:cell division protein ZapA